MERVDPRLRAALLEQLARRRETLAAGAEHVGWKLGVGERERIGDSVAVGYLTSATTLVSGSAYSTGGIAADLRVDVEVAFELSRDVDPDASADVTRTAVGGVTVALEVVDLASVLSQAEAIVASNVFHRAVAFGSTGSLPGSSVSAAVYVNGAPRARGTAEVAELVPRLVAAARILAAVDQHLRAGDRVIAGSIVQVPVEAGDDARAEIVGLGAAELHIAP